MATLNIPWTDEVHKALHTLSFEEGCGINALYLENLAAKTRRRDGCVLIRPAMVAELVSQLRGAARMLESEPGGASV